MKNKIIQVSLALCFISFTSCSQNTPAQEEKDPAVANEKNETKPTEPHRYGGWYCPDNLNGFPAVDIANWENVPVVNGRMPTKEETQNGTSLILVDTEKYPNAKPLDITMPKLATYYNNITNRNDLVIVIQAVNIDNDSIVGFRYLNGGNGSARLSEVTFLTHNEIAMMPKAQFVTHELTIAATQQEIWEVLTNVKFLDALQPIFDKTNKLQKGWRKTTNVNYHYPTPGRLISSFANLLYGCYYIQNDYDYSQYTEKFLLLEDQETKQTTLKIVYGPLVDGIDTQQTIINTWADKVKALSEM